MPKGALRKIKQTEGGTEYECTKCHSCFPDGPDFYQQPSGKPHSWCVRCFAAWYRAKADRQGIPRKRRRSVIETELGLEYLCSRCGEFWPDEPEFYNHKPSGIVYSWCKGCNSENTAGKRAESRSLNPPPPRKVAAKRKRKWAIKPKRRQPANHPWKF